MLPRQREEQQRAGDPLATGHLTSDLRGRSLRGGAATLAGQGAQFAMQAVSTVVLARLLTPSAFGLVAMVAALTGFLVIFQSLGLSTATIQKPHISDAEVTALFWINVAMGCALALLVVAIAPLIALFYHEPRLVGITMVTSLGFVFGGLGVQHQAILQRQMRFATLATINVVAYFLGVATAVGMALAGAGYWSLVALPLVPNAATTVGWWAACSWRPGRPRGIRGVQGVREILGFGGYITGFNSVNYFSRNLDNILIGWRWGSAALGFYSRAYTLLLMPLQQINAPAASVAIPALSRLQDDPARYRRAYCDILEKLTLLTTPLVAFLLGTSTWIVAVVLGPQWHQSATIFAWLGIAALVQPILSTTGWLFITQHRGREYFTWGVAGSALSIASFIVGLPYGAVGVAVAYAVCSTVISTPTLIWYVGRRGPVSGGDIVHASIRPWLVGLAVLASIAALRLSLPGLGPVVGLLLAAGLAGAIVLPVLLFTRLGRRARADARALLGRRVGAVRPSRAADGS